MKPKADAITAVKKEIDPIFLIEPGAKKGWITAIDDIIAAMIEIYAVIVPDFKIDFVPNQKIIFLTWSQVLFLSSLLQPSQHGLFAQCQIYRVWSGHHEACFHASSLLKPHH